MTTLTATRTRSGNTVHLALANSAVTVCGSKVVATLPGEVATCGRCQRTAAKIAAREATQAAPVVPEGVPAVVLSAEPFTAQLQAEAAAKRTAPAETKRDEVTATVPAPITGPRYTAVRAEGRNKVLDRATGRYTTCASRVAAEEKAAKLNRQHEAETRAADTTQAAEDAVAAVYEQFTANRRALDNSIRSGAYAPATDLAADLAEAPAVITETVTESWGNPPVPAMKPCDGTCCPPKQTCEQRDAIAAAKAEIDALAAAKAEKPTKATAPAKAKAAGERSTGLWVARAMVEGLIGLTESGDPVRASIAAKVDASTPNAQGGRTIRLNHAELLALSGYSTEVENAATEAKDGTLAMSARKLRGRLDGYLATY